MQSEVKFNIVFNQFIKFCMNAYVRIYNCFVRTKESTSMLKKVKVEKRTAGVVESHWCLRQDNGLKFEIPAAAVRFFNIILDIFFAFYAFLKKSTVFYPVIYTPGKIRRAMVKTKYFYNKKT